MTGSSHFRRFSLERNASTMARPPHNIFIIGYRKKPNSAKKATNSVSQMMKIRSFFIDMVIRVYASMIITEVGSTPQSLRTEMEASGMCVSPVSTRMSLRSRSSVYTKHTRNTAQPHSVSREAVRTSAGLLMAIIGTTFFSSYRSTGQNLSRHVLSRIGSSTAAIVAAASQLIEIE